VRIKGGLGNQLFCYSAARRLALTNNAELVIDNVTGFVRDFQYRREYALDQFKISAREATPAERLEPYERYRRAAMKWLSRKKPFMKGIIWSRKASSLISASLILKQGETLYLDGHWQSEKYFKDIEKLIRNDLSIMPPGDAANQAWRKKLAGIIQ